MKREKGNDGAGDQLGVVVLGDVGRRGVTPGDEEADASCRAEGTRCKERQEQSRSDWLGMPEHAAGAGHGHDDSGEDGQAFGSFGLGKDAGPDHVHREAGNADETCGVTDPVALAGRAEGIDGDDDACESDGDGERLAQAWILVEEDRRENGDDAGRHEDEDVEERQRHMAQCNDDAEVVGEIERGADKLTARMGGPEG